MTDLTVDQVRKLRAYAQCLQPRLSGDAWGDAVRAVCGVQAQLSAALMLALRARVSGLSVADVEAAIGSRRLVRTWVMRGTLHLLPSEDVRWIVALLSPAFIASGKRRRLQLGLDEATATQGVAAIRAILSRNSPLTRGEIVEQLAERGIVLERRSQAPIHLIGLAALEGVVCLASERNGESTYVLMDEWIGQREPVARESALAELARRYLAGYMPANVKDFAAWSGLSLTDAKRGWELLRESDELVAVHVEDRVLWVLASASEAADRSGQAEPSVRLLPAFDTYPLGYADRAYVVRPEHQHAVYHGGQTVPVVLVDGAAAGVWRYKRQGKRLSITVHPFAAFDPQIQDLIAEEAEDIGRFWNASPSLAYSAKPL